MLKDDEVYAYLWFLLFSKMRIKKNNLLGFNSFRKQLDSTFKFKISVSYLLNLIGEYCKHNNEDVLKDIVTYLSDEFMMRTITVDLLANFRSILFKKVSF